MKSTTFSRLLGASALTLCALVSAPAHAYSNLYIFGDSLSDTGNNSFALGVSAAPVIDNTYIPFAPYTSGTYTNGDVWATSFASSLGLSALPSAVVGGTNYAFGGAQTSAQGPGPGGFPYSLQSQVNYYLGTHGGQASNDALYVLAGGGNNARATLGALATPGLTQAQQLGIILNAAASYAADEGAMVDALQAAGAQNIIVWNTPNLGVTPFAGAMDAEFISTTVSSIMNQALAARLANETGVKTFDIFGLGSDVAANPGNYGLTNVSDACGVAVNQCDPATSMFWDGIHPTAYGHQLIANAMLVTAVPEPETYAMLLVGLGLIGGAARRRKAAQA